MLIKRKEVIFNFFVLTLGQFIQTGLNQFPTVCACAATVEFEIIILACR